MNPIYQHNLTQFNAKYMSFDLLLSVVSEVWLTAAARESREGGRLSQSCLDWIDTRACRDTCACSIAILSFCSTEFVVIPR